MKIRNYIKVITEYNTVLIFLVMLLVSALVSDAFFTANNLSNLVRQVAPVGIISMGMLLVILTGGIDLSVGSIVAMIGVHMYLVIRIGISSVPKEETESK